MSKPLSTPARNALLQLYRLGFLWYDCGKEEENKAAAELLDTDCAILVGSTNSMRIINNITQEVKERGHRRIEITLRGIEMAGMVYDDQQRAVAKIADWQRGRVK